MNIVFAWKHDTLAFFLHSLCIKGFASFSGLNSYTHGGWDSVVGIVTR